MKGVGMSKKSKDPQVEGPPPGAPVNASPFNKSAPIRVSFSVYVISLIVVALAVFILMLVQYLPGYRSYYKIKSGVKGADYVYVGIRIPKEELKKRNINPLTREDDIAKVLQDMGAKRSKVEINPDRVTIPGE
jgi:uncharacterized protein YneF (UPF0154 family)